MRMLPGSRGRGVGITSFGGKMSLRCIGVEAAVSAAPSGGAGTCVESTTEFLSGSGG